MESTEPLLNLDFLIAFALALPQGALRIGITCVCRNRKILFPLNSAEHDITQSICLIATRSRPCFLAS